MNNLFDASPDLSACAVRMRAFAADLEESGARDLARLVRRAAAEADPLRMPPLPSNPSDHTSHAHR